ncbi:MAG: NUDIX domain-containing protein [Candidatus Spyradocola sp.]
MELRDKNGLTEAEFLAKYQPGKYPRPSVTVDIAVLARCEGALKVLLVRRGGHPCLGQWALPGGFSQPDETTEQAAERELFEETQVRNLTLYPLPLVSTPGRDKRGWTMTQPYAALLEGGAASAKAGDDAADARWFDVAVQHQEGCIQLMLTCGTESLFAECAVEREHTPFGESVVCTLVRQQGIAFDHGRILCQAVEMLLQNGN